MTLTALQSCDAFLRDPAALGAPAFELPPPQQWPLLLAAVSGGGDSIALLDCLDRLRSQRKFRLAVVHVNHGLRGEDAAKDAQFVRRLTTERGLDFHLVEGDTRARMAEQDLSLEEAARAIRYEGLCRIAWETGARAVVTAHHLDDDVETLLMRLITGSSLAGLAGMAPISTIHDVEVWRPFLRVPQSVLYAHLQQHKLAWHFDASNLETAHLRNRIRQELLPRLRSDYNPQLVRTLGKLLRELKALRTAELPEVMAASPQELPSGEADQALEEQEELMAEAPPSRLVPAEEWQFPVVALQGMELRERWALWRAVLRGLGIPVKRLHRTTFEDLDTLISRTHGTLSIGLPGGLEARRTYGTLIFGPRQGEPEPPLPVQLRLGVWEWTDHYPGWVFLLERLDALPAEIPQPHAQRWWEGAVFQTLLLPPSEITALLVRSRLPGDVLEGPAGRVSLKEWFIDQKLPQLFRSRWPVVAPDHGGSDREGGPVLWVPGLPSRLAKPKPSQPLYSLTAIKTAHWG